MMNPGRIHTASARVLGAIATGGLLVALAACGGDEGASVEGDWTAYESTVPGKVWTLDDGKITISADDMGSTCTGTYETGSEDVVTMALVCDEAYGDGESEEAEYTIEGRFRTDDQLALEVLDGGSMDGTLTRVGADREAEEEKAERSGDGERSSSGSTEETAATTTAPRPTTTAAPTTSTAPPTTTPPPAGRDEDGIPLDDEEWCRDAKAIAATMDPQSTVAIWGDGGPDAVFVGLDWSRAWAIGGLEMGPDDHPDALRFALFSDGGDDGSFQEATWDAVAGVGFSPDPFDPEPSVFRATASMDDGEVVIDCSRPLEG